VVLETDHAFHLLGGMGYSLSGKGRGPEERTDGDRGSAIHPLIFEFLFLNGLGLGEVARHPTRWGNRAGNDTTCRPASPGDSG
jgi:hypothetical protein